MTKKYVATRVMLPSFCALVLMLSAGLDAWAQPTGMLTNYGSAIVFGEYEGTLRCLPQDFSQEKEEHAVCHHVLVMADGHVHPLYGMTAELHKQLNTTGMNGKKVRIQGKYYPVANAILVTQVSPVKK